MELKLDQKDLAELTRIIGEIPYKYSVILVQFLQQRLVDKPSESSINE